MYVGRQLDLDRPDPMHPVCEECKSSKVSITPIPGMWLQYWCNDCDNSWMAKHQKSFVPVAI